MNHQLLTRERQLIPRWRTFTLTNSRMELAAPRAFGQSSHEPKTSSDFDNKFRQWKLTPTLMSAAELVSASLVEAKEEMAGQAAAYILSNRSGAKPLVRYLAAQTIERTRTTSKQANYDELLTAARKHQWRERTRMYPQNALAWVELSLCELIEGRDRSAVRAMTVALQLAPSNRHVVRSASRLFVHLDDKERAYDTVARSGTIVSDPWLIAAEIAIASLADKNPRFVKQGRRLLESGRYHPRQVTELAGALGTLEFAAGRRKKARDLFLLSLVNPTGNTLAQLEWMAYMRRLSLNGQYRMEEWHETDEAMAYRFGRMGELAKVPDVCKKWLMTEPFAGRPYVVASTALTIIGDWRGVMKFTESGLKMHPTVGQLLNNHAFALAHLGKLPEALRTLAKVDDDDKRSTLIAKANRGLVAMRMKKYEMGRKLYLDAISGFQKEGWDKLSDVARIYFAREVAIAGLQDAEKLVGVASEANRRLDSTMQNHVLEEAEQWLRKRKSHELPKLERI